MGLAKVVLVIGGVGLGAFVLYAQRSPAAQECVKTREDRDWSFLELSNGCNRPINTIFCQKLAMGEWLEILNGEASGTLDCQSYHVAAGDSFATIKWANHNSSLASQMLATSEWVVVACDAPYRPRFTKGTNFVCEQ